MTTNIDLSQLARAALFSAERHRTQRRKDDPLTPYINHPLQLMAVLAHEAGVHDTVVLSGALLHDVLEDTETTEAELREHFGDEVTDLVLEMSDDKSLPKQVRKDLQVEHAPNASRRARAAKLADKICNLRDVAARAPQGWDLQRRREYFDWAKRVVDGLRGHWPVLEQLFDTAYALKP
ncbi:GTP pyrophosphokinase rsh [compost metagenome]